jgi:hypothetical protein
MDITMGDNHKAQFARMQHVGEHLAAERARLEAELRYVLGQAQRLDSEIMTFLAQGYGIDARRQRAQLDTARGMIVLPDVQPATAADAPAAADAE